MRHSTLLASSLALLALLAFACHANESAATPRAPLALPTPQQLAWQDLELGMFLHFAPNTWTDKEGDDLSTPLDKIDPSALDTNQWADVAVAMGARYVVFVAKHQGGFCWWPTSTTDYSVASIPWRDGRGDVLRDLAESCRARGLKLGVYLSPADAKHGAAVGGKCASAEAQRDYEALYKKQLEEVLGGYGEMCEVWFDGSLVFDVGDVLARRAPKAMVFQGPQATIRWVGNEDGIAPEPAWNVVRRAKEPMRWGTLTAADGDPDGDTWIPLECDARIRAHWFWNTKNAATLKSVAQLAEMYDASVGRGAVLLLNQTPDTTGRIPEADAQRAAEFGAEIRRRYETSVAETSGRGVELVLDLDGSKKIDCVVVQEEIADGERVREHVVDGFANGVWTELGRGNAIGHKRIERFAPVEVSKVRLRVIRSAAEPRIRRLAAFLASR